MADKSKNPAAQSMAKARWAKTTPEQRIAYAKMMVAARERKRLKNSGADSKQADKSFFAKWERIIKGQEP